MGRVRAKSAPDRPRASDVLVRYATPDAARSVWQLSSSISGFALLWYVAFLSLDYSYALTLLCAVPASIFLVRLFIIQHDCGHGAFFASRPANNLLGSLLGVLTLTPYAYWQRLHAIHHATSGHLDKRGLGDIDTLTVREYVSLTPFARLKYRIYRSAVIVFVIGPVYHFVVQHRLPVPLPATWRREWISVVGTNLALAACVVVAWQTIGLGRFFLVHAPITWLAAAAGVWLFYIQHQFERTYWERGEEWSFETASLEGSSFYDIPAWLHWCTGNIGFHHIHHLCPRIPNYRLKSCVNVHPDLNRVTRVTFRESLRCVRLKLWDEERKKLISFRAVGARRS
jgi:omega-6 fatty acid desaturase (delta-12 desaturase)